MVKVTAKHRPVVCHEGPCPPDCPDTTLCAECGTEWGYGCDKQEVADCGCPLYLVESGDHLFIECLD